MASSGRVSGSARWAGRRSSPPSCSCLAAAPFLADAVDFARRGATVFANTNADLSKPLTSPAVLGQLARPLPDYAALGTWLREDYRYPDSIPALRQHAHGRAARARGRCWRLALARELRRRRLGALFVVVPALVVYLVATPRLEPYADAKLLVMLSPMAVFARRARRVVGLQPRMRAAGIAVALALGGGVIVSDALAYRNAHIVPIQRMEALRDAAEHGSRPRALAVPGVGGVRQALRRGRAA